MRKLFVGSVLVFGTILGIACGGSDGTSTFSPDGGEAGTTGDPTGNPPGAFGGPEEAGANDGGASDANIDCDANPGACLPPAVCGDGKGGVGESCDDANTKDGDGCSSTCQIEAPYWACAFGTLCVDVRDCAALADAGLDGGCVPPPKVPACGDKILDPGEMCDDGNLVGNDGCANDCSAVEANWICPEPGKPCVSTMICGDGKLQGTEQCDDKNKVSNDGCSSSCALEDGWTCPLPGTACSAAKCGDGKVAGNEECDDKNTKNDDGCSATCRLQTTTKVVNPTSSTPGSTTVVNWECKTPGNKCTKTSCGNGTREGTEQCDDGNNKAFDGCTADCQLEPTCPGGTCEAVCGDGLLFDFDGDGDGANDEACDDGNTRNGDGCSSKCVVESGYQCAAVAAADPATLDLPVVIRDFSYWDDGDDPEDHPDFEHYGCNQVTEGLVMDTLSAAGVPVFRFNGSGDDPVTGVDPNGDCGDPDTGTHSRQLTSFDDFTDWYQDVSVGGVDRNKRIDGIQLRLTKKPGGSYVFDSDVDEPYKTRDWFLPIDGMGWGNQSDGHNYAFTTELRYWFTYDKTKAPQLDFSGDDDVWVFVNGKLALDLGGLHSREEDSFTLDNTKAGALGLTDKHLYEVALFHAERHSTGSNFKLTLRGFVKKHSVCSEVCGDNIKTPSEQCDKGAANTNDGSYGSCTKSCTLGPYCGDKTPDGPPNEQCDDGTNLTPWTLNPGSGACGPSCKTPSYCGDAILQGTFGEQCDDGTVNNTGGYGKCTSTCQQDIRCGDHKTQAAEGEECDNGFNLTSYVKHPTADDCAPGCKAPRACGDGTVDFPFEQCDNGAGNTDSGAYGSCTLECTLGPRCGDGKKNGPEQCDDGNRLNGDGCSAACTTENNGPK